MSLTVTSVRSRAERRAFIRLPFELYKNDPFWVPPLITDQKKTLSPRYPFFEHGDAELFLARRDGRVIGRISAHINHAHLAKYNDGCGFFGWFECENDQEAANALVTEAARWLIARGKGLIHMRGPCQWDTNSENLGILVEDQTPGPPCVLMSYNPPWYSKLLESAGCAKIMDLYAYRVPATTDRDEPFQRVVDAIRRRAPAMETRPLDTGSGYNTDMAAVRELFNSAWDGNWGSLPLSDAEMRVIASGLKPVIRPEVTRMGLIGGKPAGCIVCVPDINEILPKLKGRLFPFGWLTMLRGLKHIRGVRTMLLGVAPEYRGRGLEILLIAEICQAARACGFEYAELSWVLENNRPMNSFAEKLGGQRCRTYRIYQRPISKE